MIQIIIIAAPGLAALIVCMRQGPERAFLDVYLPALLLLPQFIHWPISGELTFAETAALPIGLFCLFRPAAKWHWSSADFLVIGYMLMTALAECMDKDYKLGQNLALQQFCSILLPYIAVKRSAERPHFSVEFAKRIVLLLTIVAIVSVYEVRMGSDLFLSPLMRIFPEASQTGTSFRGGFMRTQGPFGHAILAGVMMAIGYRLARWLEWSGNWPDRVRFVGLSQVRFCELWIIAGSIMTISVGPWIAAAVGALPLLIVRSRNRKRTLALLVLGIVLLGPPVYSAFNAYVSVDPAVARENGNKLQEDSAYRRRLLTIYLPLVEERPTWGWGRNQVPVLDNMASTDNAYLMTALTFGIYAAGLLVAILVSVPARLLAFALPLSYDDPRVSIAFSLIGTYLVIAVSIATVWLGWQTETCLFLITGWSDQLLSARAAGQREVHFAFRRVMA